MKITSLTETGTCVDLIEILNLGYLNPRFKISIKSTQVPVSCKKIL